jgi:hypothetical protein
MKKYMFLYWGPASAEPWQPSPEESQKVFSQWQAWKEKFKAHVADMGDGLKSDGGKVLKNGQLTDGPLVEAKEIVTGYSVIQASSLDEAVKVARECPIFLMPGASTEIREMMSY